MSDVTSQQPILDEIATAQKDLDMFAGWIARMENPDPVLRTEAAGKGIKLYDEVGRDPHAGAVLQTRYLSVVGKEWEILPAEEPKGRGRPQTVTQAQRIADFVEQALLNCNFDQFRQELLHGVLYGFYVAEVIWGVRGEDIVPVKVRSKHPRRFSFTMERELRMLTPQNMLDGEALPDRKFIVFSYGSSDNPYGSGLGQKLWWPVWFKKHGIKFWMVFLEKFGMPTVVGKYPPGTPPEQQEALLDAIDAIQNETGIRIPETMAVDFLEASRAGNVTYESLCDYMDRQISKAVLGQTLTTEVKGEGSYAASQTHDEIRGDIVKADADLLSECLNGNLIRWIVDYNFPGVTEYPTLWIRTEEGEDFNTLAERDKILVNDIGLPMTRRYFYETYGLEAPEEGEELVKGASKDQTDRSDPADRTDQPRSFAESLDESPATTLDVLGRKALNAADMASLIDPVKDLLGRCDTLEEFRDRLLDVYADMDESSLGDLMQQAMTLADLAGRFDAQR